MSNRRKHDNYPTPAHQVHALVSPLVDLLGGSLRGTVIEPCAGDGNITKALLQCKPELIVRGFDLQGGWDATKCYNWENVKAQWEQPDWTITNPPFKLALPIIENAWAFSRIGVAMMLPITWNEPCEDRREWLLGHSDNLRYIMPVCPRPHFLKGEINPKTGKEYGSANCTVAWYVWRKDWSWAEMGIQSPFQYLAGWR